MKGVKGSVKYGTFGAQRPFKKRAVVPPPSPVVMPKMDVPAHYSAPPESDSESLYSSSEESSVYDGEGAAYMSVSSSEGEESSESPQDNATTGKSLVGKHVSNEKFPSDTESTKEEKSTESKILGASGAFIGSRLDNHTVPVPDKINLPARSQSGKLTPLETHLSSLQSYNEEPSDPRHTAKESEAKTYHHPIWPTCQQTKIRTPVRSINKAGYDPAMLSHEPVKSSRDTMRNVLEQLPKSGRPVSFSISNMLPFSTACLTCSNSLQKTDCRSTSPTVKKHSAPKMRSPVVLNCYWRLLRLVLGGRPLRPAPMGVHFACRVLFKAIKAAGVRLFSLARQIWPSRSHRRAFSPLLQSGTKRIPIILGAARVFLIRLNGWTLFGHRSQPVPSLLN